MKSQTQLSLVFLLWIVPALLAGLLPAGARAQETLPNVPYLLIDTGSRSVIAANREFERWHPASLTKLMTVYVTLRAMRDGEIAPGSPVTISRLSLNTPPTRMGYPVGSKLRIDNALKILVVKSANDVALALAESVAGSVSAFVARMNGEAQRLGLLDTRFVNPNGLHDRGQYTSARDLAVLADAIWREFPQSRDMFAQPSIRAGGKIHHSYNLLLERFEGADGMKTGFVCASGYNIVASAERGSRRLLAVVLGTDSQTERAVTAARLLSEGFARPGGADLDALVRPAGTVGPVDLRNTMCSEKARKARYDPAPETAVIDSPYLSPRRPRGEPVAIALGGIDAPPAPAVLAEAFRPSRIPVPVRRPSYEPVDVDGIGLTHIPVRGTIPVPSASPLRTP